MRLCVLLSVRVCGAFGTYERETLYSPSTLLTPYLSKEGKNSSVFGSRDLAMN